LTAPIDRLSVDGGPWEKVAAWAGPWPVTERWWSVRRRRARLQVVTEEGVARLLCSERGRWWVEALYD
jgi:protein ImuB